MRAVDEILVIPTHIIYNKLIQKSARNPFMQNITEDIPSSYYLGPFWNREACMTKTENIHPREETSEIKIYTT
jgi:hypothetical protein